VRCYGTVEFCPCQVVNLVGEYLPATNAPTYINTGRTATSYIFSFSSRIVVNVLEGLQEVQVYGSIMYLAKLHRNSLTNTLVFHHK
jgi:hypothetical protein